MTMEDSVRSAMRRRLSRRSRHGVRVRIGPSALAPACEDGRATHAPARRTPLTVGARRAPTRAARASVSLCWHCRTRRSAVRHTRRTRRSRGVTVKDNVVAPLAPVTTEGSLADLPGRNADECRPVRLRPQGRRGPVDRQHVAPVRRRRRRRGQGPHRRRGRAGRPGRPDVAHPLRVDARRLRRLERRRRRRAHLRDVVTRAGRVDPLRLRRRPRRRRDRRATGKVVGRAGPAARPHRHRGDRRRRHRGPAREGHGGPGRRPRGPARGSRPHLAGHDHLHVRHHGPPEGLRADARQLPRSRRERHREARATSCAPTAPRTLLFLPLAHVFARFIEVLCVDAQGADGSRPRHQDAPRRLRRLPADVRACRAPRLREDLQLGRGQGCGRGQGQDLPPRRHRGDRLQRGTRRAAGPAWCCACSTCSSTSSSTASCGRPWAARSGTPSRVGRHSAPDSATSSAASASTSSRATV